MKEDYRDGERAENCGNEENRRKYIERNNQKKRNQMHISAEKTVFQNHRGSEMREYSVLFSLPFDFLPSAITLLSTPAYKHTNGAADILRAGSSCNQTHFLLILLSICDPK